MTGDTEQGKNVYGSSDVAALLKVKESTLRKYTLLLEKEGYSFHKNSNGQRGFFDKDVIALKKLIEIKNHPDMTLQRACNAVMTWVKENDETHSDITDIAPYQRYDDRYISEIEELKQTVNQQTELLKELVYKLDRQQNFIEEQQAYIEERLNQRDQNLTAVLRKSLEDQQQHVLQIAAAQEEQKKKGFWSKLFGK